MNGPVLARGGRLVVESWSPEYGASVEEGFGTGQGEQVEVDLDIEREPEDWAPVTPRAGPAERVAFVDGTRRVDARVLWQPSADGPATTAATSPRPGVAASVAAGVVLAVAGRPARVVEVQVARWLIVDVGEGTGSALHTRAATWHWRRPKADDPVTLSVDVQQAMADAEVEAAAAVADLAPEVDLIVVDGPIRRREGIAGVVGHIKTHHRSYLPASVEGVVGALGAGQRTPVFRVRGGGDRFAWYLRLPGDDAHDWSGIVRGEVPGSLGPADAIAQADRAAATLLRFASRPARDPRAPQNLVPVGGLETVLRHRLGDPQLLYRALRAGVA